MDKPEKEKGVTIKINGKEKPFVESKGTSIVKRQDEAATVESSDESFDWILPDDIPPSPTPKQMHSLQHKRQKKMKAPFLLAILAIMFGTGLGLLVIKTITAEQTVMEPIPVEQPVPTDSKEESPAKSKEEGRTLQTFLVQGGVYSTSEAAKDVQATIHEKNLPAEVFQIDKSYYVFLGVAESLEACKELALLYKAKGVDVFWKEIDFSTTLAKDEQEVDKLLSSYSSLVELSAAKLRQTDSSVEISEVSEQVKALQGVEYREAKENLNEASELLQNNKPSETQEKLLTFLQKIVE